MAAIPFTPMKLLGMGCFSLVYSVKSNCEPDKNNVYALKRYFIRRPNALLYAIKEFNILKRLTLSGNASPFIPTLLYAFRIHASPVLVLKQESTFTLGDLMVSVGRFDEIGAKFYISEIICGLRYLHALDIVQLDLKPDNILLSETNHIIIADFDRSFDFTAKNNIPSSYDFVSTEYYMAPETARLQVISDKADVWSLGIIASLLIGNDFRPYSNDVVVANRMAKKGQWKLNCNNQLSSEFKELLHVCFTYSYVQRPNVAQLQNLAFFKDIDWNCVQSLQISPPYSKHDIRNTKLNDRLKCDPRDPLILGLLYDESYPRVTNGNFQYKTGSDGTKEIVKSRVKVESFSEIGYTREMIVDAYRQFKFTNPLLFPHQSALSENDFNSTNQRENKH